LSLLAPTHLETSGSVSQRRSALQVVLTMRGQSAVLLG
jgi:hypothetical protein